MRPWLFGCTLAIATMFAVPAWAAPVFIGARTEAGVMPADTEVVAFSYDVRSIYPVVAARYAKSRPLPPARMPSSKTVPLLNPPIGDYMLLESTSLAEYRDTFSKAHQNDHAMVQQLMPRFDDVFHKYGDEPPIGGSSELLGNENPRQVWCQKVMTELNDAIKKYNAGYGGDAASRYMTEYARWVGQRNQALRDAALQAGGRTDFNYVGGTIGDDGYAELDLPEGVWWIACQADSRSWYVPVQVGPTGGRIVLMPNKLSRTALDLQAWTGQ